MQGQAGRELHRLRHLCFQALMGGVSGEVNGPCAHALPLVRKQDRQGNKKRACRYQLQDCCHAEDETRSPTQAMPIGPVSIDNLRLCGHLGWHFSDGHEPLLAWFAPLD